MINFLYETVPGRIILKGLVNPKVSKMSAGFFSSPISRNMIDSFVRKNDIDMDLFEIPKEGYRSFNDFFTRKKKPEHLTIDTSDMISPCDALLTASSIDGDSVFNIKNTNYSLKELLQDKELADEFIGGSAFIFRLTPAHYHRYVYCVNGEEILRKRIDGILHSVRPVCHEKYKVFIENSREYAVLDTPNMGKVIQMEVGALLVGKITNHRPEESTKAGGLRKSGNSKENNAGFTAQQGQEKGYFEYGGSSIVVLTQKSVKLCSHITDRQKVLDEIPIRIGERLS